MDDKEEIIKAIGSLKAEIAVLKEKHEHTEAYIFKELKPDIEKLCDKVEGCMLKAEECYHKNFKWMVATLLGFILAAFGWMGWILKVA
ncbi:hypothetical protein KAW18_18250 [candidate division WOR-3 bacterium]|nr:hypothetical protein [candidate division WOR-3 bacterium]